MKIPDHLQKHLIRIGGTNMYGEARFRIVWSNDQIKWDGSPVYKQPARRDRWIIEVYRDPAFFGDRETWEKTKYTMAGLPMKGLGPYPSRGRYEYIDTVETIDSEGERGFLLPSEAYLDTVVHLYDLLLASTDKEIQDKITAEDEVKRRNSYEYVLERVKEKTDPLFRPAFAAFNNTAGLTKDVVQLARSVETLA